MMYYGFCPETNPHDRLTLSIACPQDAEDATVRELLLRLHGVPTEHALRLADVQDSRQAFEQAECWSQVGPLPPQLLRCLRLLLAADPQEVDLDEPPGSTSAVSALDMECLAVVRDLLEGLQESLEPLPAEPRPLWWPFYGAAVARYRASQRALVATNLTAVTALQQRLLAEPKE